MSSPLPMARAGLAPPGLTDSKGTFPRGSSAASWRTLQKQDEDQSLKLFYCLFLAGPSSMGGSTLLGAWGQRARGVPRWDKGEERDGEGDAGPVLPVMAPSRASLRLASSRR